MKRIKKISKIKAAILLILVMALSCAALSFDVSAISLYNYIYDGTSWVPMLSTADGQQKLWIEMKNCSYGRVQNDLYVDGNVGIGTAAPTTKLEVSGDVNITGTLYGGSAVKIGGGLETLMVAGKNEVNLSGLVYLNSTSGRVGVGTATPNDKLTVEGAISLDKLSSAPSNNTGYGKLYYKEDEIDSSTKLLLHMDGSNGSTTFTDSATGKTVTVKGQAYTDTRQSAFGGASGFFDETEDNLSLATHADWDWGTDPFTIDFWMRINDLSVQSGAMGNNYYLVGKDGNWGVYLETNGGMGFDTWDGQDTREQVATGAAVFTTGTWYHVAVVRVSNTVTIYKNGGSVGSGTITKSLGDTTPTIVIGADGFNANFNGWIDEFRISKGVARWTANFDAPTSAYSAGGLMFQFENGTQYTLVPA